MALSTYADLKTEVAGWLHRNDTTARIPGFIQFATARFNRNVKSPRFEASTSLSFTAGTATKPANFRAAISLTNGTTEYKAATAADMRAIQDGGDRPDRNIYTIANNLIQIYPADTVSATFIYTAKLADFVADSDTNWLLQDYFDVYLMASLAEARKYVMDDPRLLTYEQMTIARIDEINRNELRNFENSASWHKRNDLPINPAAFDIRFG
jgi:hypothetical protein